VYSGGGWGGGNELLPPIFLTPKNNFLTTELKRGK